jgi:plasmid stability protein
MIKIEKFPHTEQNQRHNMNNHLLQTTLDLDARALCWVLSNEEVLTILRCEGVKLDALTCVYFQKKACVYDVASAYLVRRAADIQKRAQEQIQKALRVRAAAHFEARLTCISKSSMTDEEKSACVNALKKVEVNHGEALKRKEEPARFEAWKNEEAACLEALVKKEAARVKTLEKEDAPCIKALREDITCVEASEKESLEKEEAGL